MRLEHMENAIRRLEKTMRNYISTSTECVRKKLLKKSKLFFWRRSTIEYRGVNISPVKHNECVQSFVCWFSHKHMENEKGFGFASVFPR